jgi:hypothetical protein
MKIEHIVIGSLCCGFLIGCAHHESASAANNPTIPGKETCGQASSLAGGSASFTVEPSTNTPPPQSYHWVFNGANTAGVTNQ